MSRIAYYPGCSNKGSSIEYEISTQAVANGLALDLKKFLTGAVVVPRQHTPWTPHFPLP